MDNDAKEPREPLTIMPEWNRTERGHAFYAGLDGIPRLYETEDIPKDDKVVYAHYFLGGSDWYILELSVQLEAFCYAILGGYEEGQELGYTSLIELETVKVSTGSFDVFIERDLHWKPRPLGEVLAERSKRYEGVEQEEEGAGIFLNEDSD